ncbi:MAG: KpsF/GutQ family sugar-phosphate isomerase [Alphaproteobacteria bacterium]
MNNIKTLADNQNDRHSARSVLQTEIEGLQALKDSIDENFDEAVNAIDQMKHADGRGRLIVAGIGKSGHIGHKIAATLASTGTPAYFVHPGEASHGDMGMITEHDIVLMLSNSGENTELSDLIHYTRRYNIKLIAITGNVESSLGRYADLCLRLPSAPEACPNGLAPTTSTTMMLALGDALAVALLHRMGLTPEQYKIFHPGGKLGQRLMSVRELMIGYDDLPLIDETALMDQAVLKLSEKNLGSVLVTDKNGNLKGIITDGDLKRHMAADLLQRPAAQIMSTSPKTIAADALAVEAVNAMTKKPGHYISSLIVMDGEKLAGMIRLQDCIQAGLL